MSLQIKADERRLPQTSVATAVRNRFREIRLSFQNSRWGNLRLDDGQREQRIRHNIVGSLVFRVLGVGSSLLVVPLMLHILNPAMYGVWLTLSSMVAWTSYFDIGLGNGLRTRFAEAIAKGDRELAKVYVSTSYAVIFAIMLLLVALYFAAQPWLDWVRILNSPPGLADDLAFLAAFLVVMSSLRILFGLINIILTADQRPAVSSGLDALVNALSLTSVWIISIASSGSLVVVGCTVSLVSALVPLGASLLLFRGRYRDYRPTLRHIWPRQAKDLLSIGGKFLVLQVVFVVIFATDNVIISQICGPAEVTPYNIAFKYFNIVVLLFSLIAMPLWSAFTDSFHRREFDWIQAIVRKSIVAWSIIAGATILMLAFSSTAYELWIGEAVVVPFLLSAVMCVFTLLLTWNTVFTYFVNGVGKLKLQVILSVVVGILNIPLSILFAKYLHMGSAGVMLATVICLIPGSILIPVQYLKIVNGRASGIWNA